MSLTKDEKGYGLGFDKFPTGVYVTRVVEGGVAHATGKVLSLRRRQSPSHHCHDTATTHTHARRTAEGVHFFALAMRHVGVPAPCAVVLEAS